MDNLFNNIGEKIKALATAVFAIGAVLFGLGGLVLFIVLIKIMLFITALLIGAVAAGVGILFSYIGSMFLYGFGELISNSKKLVDMAENGSVPGKSKYEPETGTFLSDIPSVMNNTAMPQPEAKPTPKPVPREAGPNEWKCPKCGSINQNYVGTCGCGESKPR